MVSHLCSTDSLVLFRCPTPQRRAYGTYGYRLLPPACCVVHLLQTSPRSPGSRAWSFQTCLGSKTTQGQLGTRISLSAMLPSATDDSVGAPIEAFRSSIPSPSFPCLRFNEYFTAPTAKLGAEWNATPFS